MRSLSDGCSQIICSYFHHVIFDRVDARDKKWVSFTYALRKLPLEF
ncbi:hypothetical protein RLO149_c025950 [Roseobacter litoralis Och 149]|uniref:Uncharacterized protein n=1 Tax=Roseobacter litoralis (strain ATCC 49566 / DSM 6996 / JCM 21268 / NBRC 15278 / OCh 149) TaxID=391595 RepID=F7ZDF6_ROSLO|nr:hypothetical protein RLO149_c025950 [Roseobacter litoralis Och 149]